ncbi:MAG: phosphotransferase [Chloroflexi bacterium]|nr:phosphotransferase [Chloroflexota bacterium]
MEAFLVARFGREVSAVSMIGQGEWSTAYAFRWPGERRGDYVIRFGAFPEDFAKDRLAARYRSRDLPIPQILEIGEAFDGSYAISARAFGDYLDALDLAQMRRVLPSLFAALDAARLVDLSASAGYGGWGADGTAPHPTWRAALLDVSEDRPTSRTHGWGERLAASPTGAGPFKEAFGYVQALVDSCPEERHLIHSDLLNRNVLVAGDRLTAVLDWGCSLYGDFLYDLAWLSFWSPWYPAWQGIDFRREAARHYESIGLDVPHFEERLRCYQVHIGLLAQAYNAFRGRWAELDATARRTLDVARSGR